MILDAGSTDGVAAGDAVTFGGNFVGLIQDVTAHSSVAETIFDPDFKMPVRIGTQGYDALLVGGSYPMAESIVKTATIAAGDVVYSAAPGIPYAIARRRDRKRRSCAEQSFRRSVACISVRHWHDPSRRDREQ